MIRTSQFLAAFRQPDELLHIRAFKPKKQADKLENRALLWDTNLAELTSSRELQSALKSANQTRGIYFCPNVGGATDDSIIKFTAFFAEDDARSIPDQHFRLDSAPLVPSIRVETRNSVHSYWMIDGECSEADWRDVQARLIAYFGGDPKIKNPARVMRLPGFDHLHLNGNGIERKKVMVHTFEPARRFAVAEILEAFPAVPSKPSSKTSTSASSYESHEDRHAELCQRIMARGRRNSKGNWDACALCHNGKGEKGLVYFPATGAVKCNAERECSYFSILRAEGLPDEHLPSREKNDNIKKETEPAWETPAAFYEHSLPTFPVVALPDWHRDYVTGLAHETQTPLDLAAMQTLAVSAGAVAGRVRIQARPGWIEPLNVYTLTVLPSGERKSAVSAAACEPLEELESNLVESQRDVIAEAVCERRVLEERLTRLEKEAARAEDTEGRRAKRNEAVMVAQELAALRVPAVPRLVCDDVTPETLATLLAEQGGRICNLSAEGGIFETLAGRYSGTPNFDVILKGHCGDTLRVDRRGRAEHVPHRALTIGLCVQPDVMRGLVDKPGFRGRGLIGRFLYSLPVSTLGRRKIAPQPMSQTIRDKYARAIKTLAQIQPAKTASGDPVPRMLYLTAEAQSVLKEFEAELEPQLGDHGSLGAMSDWAGKLAGAILRIVGILSLGEKVENLTPFPERVDPETMRRAIAIGRYLIPHAQAGYAEMGADPQVELAKYLLRWIERNAQRSFTRREAHQANRSRFKKVAELDPVLSLLEDHGYIRPVSQSSDGPGRKPSQTFDVNPALFSSSQNTHNTHNSISEDFEHSETDSSDAFPEAWREFEAVSSDLTGDQFIELVAGGVSESWLSTATDAELRRVLELHGLAQPQSDCQHN